MMLDYHSARNLEKLQKEIRDTLEQRNVAHMGDIVLVRIPDIPGKIRHIPRSSWEGSYSVEYKSGQWYDAEAGQTRNEKHIIGMVLPEYPMAMLPNDNYYQYFDITTGKPLRQTEKEKETAGTATDGKGGADSSAGNGNTDNSTDNKPDRETPDEPGCDPDDDDNTISDEEFLRIIDSSRKMAAEEKQKKKKRAEEEERRKRKRELYGDDDEAVNEAERQEAYRELMKLFGDASPEEDGISAGQPESRPETPEEKEEDSLQAAYLDYNHARERTAILKQIMDEILTTIRTQAKKRPDDIVNTYKIIKINALLQEIRERYQGTGYEDLLDLLDIPQEEEKDGRIIRTGPTYSDAEVLLDHYHTILYFVQIRNR